MKILHCCLSNFYIEGYNYQENMITRQNKIDGHEVMVIASTEDYTDNKTYGYVEPCDYVNDSGIRVVRVPYRNIVSHKISRKIRAYLGVYELMEKFAPDVILFHGANAWELLNVAKYSKKRGIRLLVDSHTTYGNSGRNWVSLHVLHGFFYRLILKRTLPQIEKILCIAPEAKKFVNEVYKVPEKYLKIWPLGGIILEDEEYEAKRKKSRQELGVSNEEIVLVHSGKMGKGKKTCELVKAFKRVENNKIRLVIVGSLLEEIESEALELFASDNRICYLGWKSGTELLDLMCGADAYLQPGTESVAMQNSMCCRCAVMIRPSEVYDWIVGDRGYCVTSDEEIYETIKNISEHTELMKEKQQLCYSRAQEILNYKVIARELYH